MRRLIDTLQGKEEPEVAAIEARSKRILVGSLILDALIGVHMLAFLTVTSGLGAYARLSFPAVLLWSAVLSGYAYFVLYSVSGYREGKALERAFTDEQTGLLNRDGLRACLEDTYVAGESAGKWTRVLYVNIMNLADINSNLGYAMGDDTLQDVAKIIEDRVREGDSVGRVTGSQFLVVMPSATSAEAECTEGRLLQGLSHYAMPVEEGQERIALDPEIGMASYPLDGEHIDDLIFSSRKEALRTHAEGHGRESVPLIALKGRSAMTSVHAR